MSTKSPRVIVYAEGTDLDVASLIGSGVTHAILSFVHIGDDGLPAAFSLAEGQYYLVYNSTKIFGTTDFNSYIAALDAGQFPQGLRQASAPALAEQGYPPLSQSLKIVTLTKGQRWGLLDESNGYLYRINTGTDQGTPDLELWDPQWVNEAQLDAFWADAEQARVSGITLLASMGGGGVAGDWNNLIAATDVVSALFVELMNQRKISGVDMDVEEVLSAPLQTAVSSFMNNLHAEKSLWTVPIFTAAPYGGTWGWFIGLLPMTVLDSANLFTWWNIQMYMGEFNIGPDQVAATFDSYVGDVAAAKAGIPGAAAFLSPGWNASPDGSPQYTPSVMQTALGNIVAAQPTVAGAFVWNLGNMTGDESTWAAAITAGLGGG